MLVAPALVAMLVVPVSMSLLRGRRETTDDPRVAALREKYRRFTRWEDVVALPGAFVLIALSDVVLRRVADWRYRDLPLVVYAVGPDESALLLPAIFMGLGMLWVVVAGARRAILGAAAVERSELDWIQLGGTPERGRRMSRALGWLCVIGVSLLAAGVLDTYSVITNDEIVSHGFASWQISRYRIDDIQSVSWVRYVARRGGRLIERPHVVVGFPGGGRWSSLGGMRSTPTSDDWRIASFLSARSGRPIERTRLEPG